MNLVSPFMMVGTKTPYKLKQACIFQLLDCLSVYGMKVLKAKTVHKIYGLIRDIQYSIFFALLLTRHTIQFLFEIFHPQSNADLVQANLALMHMTTFILQSWNLEWQEKESIIFGEVYFKHRLNHCMKIPLLFKIAVLKIFDKFQEKHPRKSSYCISSSEYPLNLLNFENVRCSAYQREALISGPALICGNTVFSIFASLRFANMLNMSSVTNVFLEIF